MQFKYQVIAVCHVLFWSHNNTPVKCDDVRKLSLLDSRFNDPPVVRRAMLPNILASC